MLCATSAAMLTLFFDVVPAPLDKGISPEASPVFTRMPPLLLLVVVESAAFPLALVPILLPLTTEFSDEASTVVASVEMGEVRAGRPSVFWNEVAAHPDRPVAHLDLGNPHTVVGVDEVRVVDLGLIGSQVPDVNLEIVEPGPEPTAITMRVHERGAGITRACGTGACAAADAAYAWGLVPRSHDEVIVHMDGGDARVRVSADRRATLIGPTNHLSDHTVTA